MLANKNDGAFGQSIVCHARLHFSCVHQGTVVPCTERNRAPIVPLNLEVEFFVPGSGKNVETHALAVPVDDFLLRRNFIDNNPIVSSDNPKHQLYAGDITVEGDAEEQVVDVSKLLYGFQYSFSQRIRWNRLPLLL